MIKKYIKETSLSSHYFFYFLVLLLLFTLFYRLGTWGVIDTSEARYAEIPRVMLESGDYLHPSFLGIHHYHKPPLTYYVTSFSYYLFGVNAFSARIFLQIALVVQLILVFYVGKNLFGNRKTGILASIIYASFFIVWISCRNLTTDAYLNTWILAAVWAILNYLRKEKSYYLYLFAIFTGLGFLTKGTALLVILGPVVLALYWKNKKSVRWNWHMIPAFFSFLVISLSWFYLLELEGKAILKYLFYDQSIVRYTSEIFSRSKPIYFYILLAPILSFPWFFILIQVLLQRRKSFSMVQNELLLFFAWCIFPIIFFSFSSSKLILYVLPAFPALAIFTAHFFIRMHEKQLRFWFIVQLTFYGFLVIALSIYPLIMSHYIISGHQYFILFLLLGLLFILILNKEIALKEKMAYAASIFTFFLVLFATHFFSLNQKYFSTSKPVADWIIAQGLQDRTLYVYDRLVPSIAFHLQKPVITISRYNKREIQFEDDLSFLQRYLDINDQDIFNSLIDKFQLPTLLLCRKKTAGSIDEELLSAFRNKEEIGLWYLYY